MELDEDPPCRCVRIDVDLDDARDCPLHGPDSELAHRERQQEADDLAAYYAQSSSDDDVIAIKVPPPVGDRQDAP